MESLGSKAVNNPKNVKNYSFRERSRLVKKKITLLTQEDNRTWVLLRQKGKIVYLENERSRMTCSH